MPSLIIRHVTTYRYRQPVAFGEHRMMLRPRDSHDQRVIEASLEISPEPRSLHFVQDAFGNHVGIARFSGRSKELCFESTVCLEHSPLDAADSDLEDPARPFPRAGNGGIESSNAERFGSFDETAAETVPGRSFLESA